MHADAYSMNKMMHIIGTIAIAVVACLAFSYLVNDDGTNYTIREDLVVGDYVEYEYNYYETQIKEKEMSTEDFIKGFQYDVSSMEKGDDVDFMYMGNNIKCTQYTADKFMVLLAKGSDCCMYTLRETENGFKEFRQISVPFDISMPMNAEDLQEGMESQAQERIAHGDYMTYRLYTVTLTSLENDTASVHTEREVTENHVYKITIASINDDRIIDEDGDEWSTSEFIEMASYKERFSNISKEHPDMEVTESRENLDFEFKSGDLDVTEITYTGGYGEDHKIRLVHFGDVLVYDEEIENDNGNIYVETWEFIDSSLLE